MVLLVITYSSEYSISPRKSFSTERFASKIYKKQKQDELLYLKCQTSHSCENSFFENECDSRGAKANKGFSIDRAKKSLIQVLDSISKILREHRLRSLILQHGYCNRTGTRYANMPRKNAYCSNSLFLVTHVIPLFLFMVLTRTTKAKV